MVLLKLSRTRVSVQCLDQRNQFNLLGEAFGVKAVGRRGGGVLPDLGLGVYEAYERCRVPEKSMEFVLDKTGRRTCLCYVSLLLRGSN